MRKAVIIILLFCVVSFCLAADKYDLLKIEADIIPKRLSRGQEGKV